MFRLALAAGVISAAFGAAIWLRQDAIRDDRARAHDDLHVDMNMLPASEIDPRMALKSLPPLIKGYLRLGAYVGDGAVIDHQFGTTDVLIILPVEAIDERYFAHFGAPDELENTVSLPEGRRLN